MMADKCRRRKGRATTLILAAVLVIPPLPRRIFRHRIDSERAGCQGPFFRATHSDVPVTPANPQTACKHLSFAAWGIQAQTQP